MQLFFSVAVYISGVNPIEICLTYFSIFAVNVKRMREIKKRSRGIISKLNGPDYDNIRPWLYNDFFIFNLASFINTRIIFEYKNGLAFQQRRRRKN